MLTDDVDNAGLVWAFALVVDFVAGLFCEVFGCEACGQFTVRYDIVDVVSAKFVG